MKTYALLVLCTVLVPLLSASTSSALSVPEKLVYEVSWTGLKAGTVVQQVTASGDELHIVSTTRSAGWITPFFPVNDRSESVLIRGAGSEHIGMPKYFR